METELAISVIIPAYKGAHLLPRALASVSDQTVLPKEVIVIDDGSPDDIRGAIEAFQSSRPRRPPIRYLRQANAGVAGARNLGIRHADGDWIALLDQDDEWETDHLAWLAELATRLAADMVAGDCRIRSHGGERPSWMETAGHGRRLAELQRDAIVPDFFEHLLCGGCFFLPSTVLVRRLLLMEKGLFDPGLAGVDDYEMWLRVAPAARFALSSRTTGMRWEHGANVSSRPLVMITQSLRLWRKVARLSAVRAEGRFRRLVRRRVAQLQWERGYWSLQESGASPDLDRWGGRLTRPPAWCFAASFAGRPSWQAGRGLALSLLPAAARRRLRRGSKRTDAGAAGAEVR